MKSKGWVIDTYVARTLQRRRYRHAVGYATGEERRAVRDGSYDTAQRSGWYPLIEWGWDRDRCQRYIAQHTGVEDWPKSACTFCPFALTNRSGLARTLDAFREHPRIAIDVLAREHHALCLNRRQGLIAGRRLRDTIAAEPDGARLLAGLQRHLDAVPHALYEVRRILRPRATDRTKVANSSRHLRILDRGSRTEMNVALARVAGERGLAVDTSDIAPRAWTHRIADRTPGVEQFLVAGTAGAHAKGNPNFERWWRQATAITSPT